MMNLASVVGQLKKERDRATKEVERLNAALAALNGSSGKRTTTRGTMSAAGRARIVAAQKARWAKLRAAKVESKSRATSPKRTMSAAARAKIAKAQRLRWAMRKKRAQRVAAA